jgi:hypothetical protein
MGKTRKTKPAPPGTKPGTPNPDNPREVCVECPSDEHEGNRLRWLTNTTSRARADGYRKLDRSCAAKLQARQYPESRQGRLLSDERPLLCGTKQFLKDRLDEHHLNGTTPAVCGICDDPFTDKKAHNKREVSFCESCEPWAAATLPREQCNVSGPERDVVYANIKRARQMLKRDTGRARLTLTSPFFALVKKFAEVHPNADPQSPGVQDTAKAKHLLLFFQDKPIGEFVLESADEFTQDFLKGADRLGARRPASARRLCCCGAYSASPKGGAGSKRTRLRLSALPPLNPRMAVFCL